MINGFATPGPEWEIPYRFILARTRDTVYRVDKGQVKMIVQTGNHSPIEQLFNVQKTSLHCMDKVGLQFKYEELLKAYNDE